LVGVRFAGAALAEEADGDAASGLFTDVSSEGSVEGPAEGSAEGAEACGEFCATVKSFSFVVKALSCPCIWFTAALAVAACAVSWLTTDFW